LAWLALFESVSIVMKRRREGAMSSYQTQPSPLLPQQVLGVTILIFGGVLFVGCEKSDVYCFERQQGFECK